MRYLLLILALTGCTQTRTDRQADTEKRDTFTVEGSASVPMPQGGTALVPVSFTVERVGSERLVEHSESKTQIDAAAIAAKVSDVVAKSLSGAVAQLTGGLSKGFTPTEGGLLGGLGGAALLAGREWMARRREQDALIEVKAARNAAQAEALALAKLVPPPGSSP